eukprot:4128687-Pyramimonas_sp.AAC.1
MCRKLASLLVECGAGRLSLEECLARVESGDAKLTPRAAPAHGLELVKVVYRHPDEDRKGGQGRVSSPR